MKSSTIKQLMENYINQKKSNKNIPIQKLPTQTNHNIKTKKNIHKDIKNPSIKTRRKPRIFNGNKNYYELNKKKLKSCSRYKDTHNNKNHKYKILAKNTKPNMNMNRTICTDGYGNIIANTHDRNLSAPSLNYDTNLKYYKKYLNKKKKNNIIKLNKADKKVIDENLINRDNYMNYNSMRDNNLTLNHDKLPSNLSNRNTNITENNIYNIVTKDELDDDALIKVKTLDKEDNNYINIHKNNLNIKNYNYYKNKNKINKKYNDNNNNDNSTIDISNFIKDIEIIKNTQESIALLKEQMKEQDNYYKNNNKPKLNKTINININDNQINTNNKNKYKRNNKINLTNKDEYAISNFQNYNKYAVNKKNKNKININKANNNTYYNETINISKDITPNKQIANTTRGNISLSNSSNNKILNISSNITNNNNNNNFGKKINLTSIYGEENEKDENCNNKEYSNPKEQEIIVDKNIDNNNENNIKNKYYTEINEDKNIVKDSTNDNDEVFSYRSNNNNNDKISNKVNNITFSDDKNSDIKPSNKDNIENNKKSNSINIPKPNKNININTTGKGPNLFSINIKNKNNSIIKGNNKIKEKKDINNNHIPPAQKQSKPANNNNKKKNFVKNIKNNKINDIRFHTINNEHNERYNNFDDNQIKSKKRINNNDKSYDIENKNKNKEDVSKQKLKKLSKTKDMYKNIEDLKIRKKNSCKPYINKNKHNSVDTNHDENISQNKVKKYLTKGDFKYKSIYKIGVICEAGEVVFGEKKTNQDNYFNCLINDDLRFIGVCDGHGEYGHHVSKYLRNYLPLQFEKYLQKLFKKEESMKNLLLKEMSGNYNTNIITKSNINSLDIEESKNNIFEKMKKVFEKSFSKTDNNLSEYCENLQKNANLSENEEENSENYFNVEYSGSTCVSILIKEKNINTIYIANVGDSRAIIIKELENKNYSSYQLSRDHKPTEEDEAQRILDYDGEIEKIEDDDGNWTGPLRVWVKESDGPGLAMTRSFGDEVGASVGVVSEPEVGEYKIKEEDKAIIIASDGLWEYMTNEDVTDFVKKLIGKKDPNIIVNELYKESVNRWRLKDQGIDDITIICILLKTN